VETFLIQTYICNRIAGFNSIASSVRFPFVTRIFAQEPRSIRGECISLTLTNFGDTFAASRQTERRLLNRKILTTFVCPRLRKNVASNIRVARGKEFAYEAACGSSENPPYACACADARIPTPLNITVRL